ncbi:MAG: ABC transporter C-terminal domain-containing protein, partial [Thermodesulfobacteriota bacterium]
CAKPLKRRSARFARTVSPRRGRMPDRYQVTRIGPAARSSRIVVARVSMRRPHAYIRSSANWAETAAGSGPAAPPKKAKPRTPPVRPRKLTFKEQRELEQMPDVIERLEVEKRTLFDTLSDPALYKSAGAEIAGHKARLEELERDLAEVYARWELLEDLALQAG